MESKYLGKKVAPPALKNYWLSCFAEFTRGWSVARITTKVSISAIFARCPKCGLNNVGTSARDYELLHEHVARVLVIIAVMIEKYGSSGLKKVSHLLAFAHCPA